jgi:predicted transcriptional regulator
MSTQTPTTPEATAAAPRGEEVTNPAEPAPRPVLLSFHPKVAEAVATEGVPWEFRRRPSGHERGTRVLMYSSAPVRAFTGAYTCGAAFAYDSLESLRAGVWAAERKRYAPQGVPPEWARTLDEWLGRIHKGLPVGHAFEIREPVLFETPIPLGPREDGHAAKPPQGFQYLDLERVEHRRLWKAAQDAVRLTTVEQIS